MMDGYQKRTEQKKEAILTAARELFFQKGLAETSIADIAKRANVSQVTIYNYFESKVNLTHQVIRSFLVEKIAEAEQLVESDLPFPEKIEKILFDEKASAALFNQAGFAQFVSLQNPEILSMVEEFSQNRTLPLFLTLLKQGQEEGYVAPGISEQAVFVYMSAFIEMMRNPDIFSEENDSLRMELADMFFYGLVGKRRENQE